MIDLARPALYADGITVFHDHADPARFHYLPDRPRLRAAADGAPDLKLVKYRLDPLLAQALGAGLLSLTVDLFVEPERLARLRGRLSGASAAGPVQLTSVVADDGACDLMIMGAASDAPSSSPGASSPASDSPPASNLGALVTRVVGAGRPSLFGDNACTFMVVLTTEGAALAEGALRRGSLPAGVVYTLRTTAIRPALRARITARWSDIYKFYENRLHGGKLLFATDIGTTMEQLVQSEALSVQIDQLVPPAEQPAAYQRAIDQAQRYVLEELFKPTLGQAPPPSDDGTGPLATIGRAIKDLAGFFSLTYSLRDVDRKELKTFTYDLAGADAERLTLSPQGTLQDLVASDINVDRLIVTVEPAAAAEMHFDIGSALNLQTDDIDHLEIMLHYGADERHLVLDAASPHQSCSIWYRADLGGNVRYQYEVHFGASIASATQVVRSGERITADRVVRLDPRELYQLVVVRAVAVGVPFDRYAMALVDLKATEISTGWSTAVTLQLDATHSEATFRMRAAPDHVARIDRQIRYVDVRGVQTIVAWDTVQPGVLIVPNPLPDILDLQILASARFGTVVKRLIVELRPIGDPASTATFILTADQPSATWSRAVAEGATREYEYRVTVHTASSEVREGKWLAGPPGKLIVGEGFARLRQVDLMLVGPSLAALGLLGIKVRFEFRDTAAALYAEDEIFAQDLRTPVHWTYPVADPSRQAYTYQLTLVRTDGSQTAQPSVTTSDLLAIQSIP